MFYSSWGSIWKSVIFRLVRVRCSINRCMRESLRFSRFSISSIVRLFFVVSIRIVVRIFIFILVSFLFRFS